MEIQYTIPSTEEEVTLYVTGEYPELIIETEETNNIEDYYGEELAAVIREDATLHYIKAL